MTRYTGKVRELRFIPFAALLLAACMSGPRARVVAAVDRGDLSGALEAYEDFRTTEGVDADVLARVAGLLLEREARSEERTNREAALLQLSLAGTAGEPILTRLSRERGTGPARIGALTVLARRGREHAVLALRALADHPDLDVVAASVVAMDPALDRRRLLGLLTSTHVGVRAAAAAKLGSVADRPDVVRALAEAARVDPEARVRAAAVRALGQGGRRAIDALRERLGDADAMVRLAAVGGLMQADREQAWWALGPLLEVAPSPAGIEAARWLAQERPDTDAAANENVTGAPARAAAARLFLRRALFARDASLRSQAGVALVGLPDGTDAPFEAVREALVREEDDQVRLSLARALWRHDARTATRAFERLLSSSLGMPRVQAASELAKHGHRRARELLFEVVGSDAPVVLRRTAARALARDALEPDVARAALRDDSALVRIYAAGGILAAAAAT